MDTYTTSTSENQASPAPTELMMSEQHQDDCASTGAATPALAGTVTAALAGTAAAALAGTVTAAFATAGAAVFAERQSVFATIITMH